MRIDIQRLDRSDTVEIIIESGRRKIVFNNVASAIKATLYIWDQYTATWEEYKVPLER